MSAPLKLWVKASDLTTKRFEGSGVGTNRFATTVYVDRVAPSTDFVEIGPVAELHAKLILARAELAAAYRELRTLKSAVKSVFDRDVMQAVTDREVWDRAARDGMGRIKP